MREELIRTAMLLGEEAVETLGKKRVAVFGIGGVGGHAVEALARSGVGALDLIDSDVVSRSNLNRQIIATLDTLGRCKTEVMRERILSVNPDCRVVCRNTFYLPEKRGEFPFDEYDFIVDAIDTVTAKIDLALAAQEYGVPIVSSMGTGNKLDPSRLEIADIYETSVCPLAKVMRRELKRRGVRKLTVVYSREEARKTYELSGGSWEEDRENGKSGGEKAEGGRRGIPGSSAFVPAAAGLLMASYVIRQLAGSDQREGDGGE